MTLRDSITQRRVRQQERRRAPGSGQGSRRHAQTWLLCTQAELCSRGWAVVSSPRTTPRGGGKFSAETSK